MTVRTYFSWMLAFFVAAFLVLPTSKMVNNFYYVFIAIPGLYLLLRNYQLLKPSNFTEWVFVLLCVVISFYSFFTYPRVIVHSLYILVFIYSISRFVDTSFLILKRLHEYCSGEGWYIYQYVPYLFIFLVMTLLERD